MTTDDYEKGFKNGLAVSGQILQKMGQEALISAQTLTNQTVLLPVVVIEMGGGSRYINVLNLLPGQTYQVVNYDNKEKENDA